MCGLHRSPFYTSSDNFFNKSKVFSFIERHFHYSKAWRCLSLIYLRLNAFLLRASFFSDIGYMNLYWKDFFAEIVLQTCDLWLHCNVNFWANMNFRKLRHAEEFRCRLLFWRSFLAPVTLVDDDHTCQTFKGVFVLK